MIRSCSADNLLINSDIFDTTDSNEISGERKFPNYNNNNTNKCKEKKIINRRKYIRVSVVSVLIMGSIGYLIKLTIGMLIFSSEEFQTTGLLYPRESETRDVKSLDGIWQFAKSKTIDPAEGYRGKWWSKDLSKSTNTINMPVPSSYNDITEDQGLRDHVGVVWYDRKFFVPQSYSKQRVWIRFGSVHYLAVVWINGNQVVKHEIGHLPFEAEITDFVKYGKENRVTVLCDNVLLQDTIPQGRVTEQPTDNGTERIQSYTFDFFNYAGIHRSVVLFTTPQIAINDIDIKTDVVEETGFISYNVQVTPKTENITNDLELDVIAYDRDGLVAGKDSQKITLNGIVEIPNVKLWWPYLMNPDPDYALLTKDFNLLRWIGANCYRTSHYPYSEESMQFADENGIMIIDECPSVDTDDYSNILMTKHKSSIEQLIHRDKHHASVIMWSIANEPRTGKTLAGNYFKEIAGYTRLLDPTRPVTAAIAVNNKQDGAAQHMDILMFNRYNAWYSNTGRLDMVTKNVIDEATSWHQMHNKPVLMSEYGADTVEGLHILPAYVWSEEFQEQLFAKHFLAFDHLRQAGFFIGEFVWNFADFKTAQSKSSIHRVHLKPNQKSIFAIAAYTRVGGNKKGVFTRSRQPKSAAYILRKRYHLLSQELDGTKPPKDIHLYIHRSIKTD
uniref:CSON000008 protein n=1 Tax=Culicoides sonorensis TaxID=179676 RepID=A0A336KUJ1_CULSO